MSAKPELLSPAGDLDKLKTAIDYGADAVYMGGLSLGMRAKSKNFGLAEMEEGIGYAKARGKRAYVTANILARNADFDGMGEYFRKVQAMGADALIVSDPGVFMVARKSAPRLEIHISTQANCTNANSARFWRDLGASRVILARELSLAEISQIDVEGIAKEAFAHGAMCMAYSGRCIISNYMSGRDANRGECSQPCRWGYTLVEEKSGEALEVVEEGGAAFVFSSRDLCMAGHIGEMVGAGIKSLKIEGRMKTEYYVAIATKTYREAIDDYFAEPPLYESKLGHYARELSRVSQRGYTTGFYFGPPGAAGHAYSLPPDYRAQDFLAVVKSYDARSGMAAIEQRNKFRAGDAVEILSPGKPPRPQLVRELRDAAGRPVLEAPHPKQTLLMRMDAEARERDIVRARRGPAEP